MKKYLSYITSVFLTVVISLLLSHIVLASVHQSATDQSNTPGLKFRQAIGNTKIQQMTPYASKEYYVSNHYVTVANNDCGINSDVVITVTQEGYNGWLYQMNIIMTDKYGNVLQRFDNATGIAADGHWWARSRVARVQLQIAPRNWFIEPRGFWVRCSS